MSTLHLVIVSPSVLSLSLFSMADSLSTGQCPVEYLPICVFLTFLSLDWGCEFLVRTPQRGTAPFSPHLVRAGVGDTHGTLGWSSCKSVFPFRYSIPRKSVTRSSFPSILRVGRRWILSSTSAVGEYPWQHTLFGMHCRETWCLEDQVACHLSIQTALSPSEQGSGGCWEHFFSLAPVLPAQKEETDTQRHRLRLPTEGAALQGLSVGGPLGALG